MNTAEATADANAAFAIESAASPGLQAVMLVVSKEIVRDVWLLGYCTGRRDSFDAVLRMMKVRKA